MLEGEQCTGVGLCAGLTADFDSACHVKIVLQYIISQSLRKMVGLWILFCVEFAYCSCRNKIHAFISHTVTYEILESIRHWTSHFKNIYIPSRCFPICGATLSMQYVTVSQEKMVPCRTMLSGKIIPKYFAVYLRNNKASK